MSDPHATLVHVEQPGPPARMHPLVAAAMATGNPLDPATLRELLAVQQAWEAGEAKKLYTRAMVALKRDLPTVLHKDKLVDFEGRTGNRTTYRHTSLASALEQITEPLTAHGFSLSWTPRTAERRVFVTCRLTHADGHVEETTLDSEPDTSGSKSSAQAIASTITLLSRYSALALLGIATADMTEPQGEAEPAAVSGGEPVDVDRNLRAAAKITKLGRKVEGAAAIVGRPVQQWTAADIGKIKDWLRDTAASPSAPDSGPPPEYQRQPGDEG